MAGSYYGNLFKITTWGESHGKGVGVVLDGCPAGVLLDEKVIQKCLDRRKPGQDPYQTPRKESDQVEILSGVFEGKTTGTPISMVVYNHTQRSGDYKEIASYYRPGHGDYTYDAKYGFRDYRGGGRSSGRETIGRVAAGAVALQILKELKISVTAYVTKIGPVEAEKRDLTQIEKNPFRMPDGDSAQKAKEYLEQCIREGDSTGGVIECEVTGIPAGLGDPVFEKLDANLAKALMSIGGVKAVEIGDGCKVGENKGSENNDAFVRMDGKISKASNHAGGILAGISDGSNLILRATIKGTPSIHKKQRTVNREQEEIEIEIGGRHDPVIMPRAVPVVEAMTALTLVDALLQNMTARLDGILTFYER